jgi:acetyl/propionyl-CoA carboxylase alpha subunit
MQHLYSIDGQAAEAWLSRTERGYRLLCDGARLDVALDLASNALASLTIDDATIPLALAAQGDRVWIHLDGAAHEIVLEDPIFHHAAEDGGSTDDIIRAPMPGAVIAVHVQPGSVVKAGDALLIIESMKLETVLKSPRDGIVEMVGFDVGRSFDRDAVLVTLADEA